MTEEEKKAMWYLEEVLVDTTTDIEQWKVIENLIEKQQEEIEKLKQEMEERLIGREEITKYEMGYEIENNYISKDKINDKIIELEKKRVLPEHNEQNIKISYKIEALLELLEEGNDESKI